MITYLKNETREVVVGVMKKDAFCWFRSLYVVSLVSAFIGVLLMIVRIWHAFSFSEPLQLITSGWEEDSLYAMWKYVADKKIYGDGHAIPYAMSVFNWLFYQAYGFLIKTFISLFSLSTSWIPTIGRFFTLVGALIGVFVCYASFVKVSRARDSVMKMVAFSLALMVFLGPLVGFWAFTVRPDVWSFVFEVTGVFLFWKYYSKNKIEAIFFSSLALYCAWAFKHSYIYTVTAISLFLLLRKEFKVLSIFLLLMIIFYSITFLLGDEDYFNSIFCHAARGFSFCSVKENILKAALKSFPAIVTSISSFVFVFLTKGLKREIIKEDRFLFPILLLFVTTILSIPGSGVIGAADNYYFMEIYALSLVAVTLLNKIYDGRLIYNEKNKNKLKIFVGLLILGWGIHIAVMLPIFMGYKGVLSVYPQHVDLIKKQKCIERFPNPLFVDHMYLSLPWMNPSEPYVFTNWFYGVERKAGVLFKDGGRGGLIQKGHYKTLLLNEESGIYDGVDLSGYKILPEKCEGFYVYIKNNEP